MATWTCSGRTSTWASALLLGCLLAGCAQTYAPPLQSIHGGAPARVAEGDLALQGGAVGYGAPSIGGAGLSYGLRDSWAVEVGGNMSHRDWGMGWAGLRYTHAPRRYAKNYLALDVQLAGGAGWGGRADEFLSGPVDGRDPLDRIAGGGALDAGVAGHFSFFAVYARARGQLTGATNIPATLWGDAGVGVQFRIARSVDLYTQAMWAGYRNRLDNLHFRAPLYEVGFAVRIPTLRSRGRYR